MINKNTEANLDLPTISDVLDAIERVRRHAFETPLLRCEALNEQLQADVYLKAENLQRTGSFKIRGASNKLELISPKEREKGVVAHSSGNHAQGVAAAAKDLGLKAAIVMPKDTPKVKVERTKGHGGEVVFYDRYTEIREEIANQLATERGAILVPPYDDKHIIAGQGTIGIEVIQDLTRQAKRADYVISPVGGGGLIGGIGLAVKHFSPDTELFGVEPVTHDDFRRSLEAGHPVANDPQARTVCDAVTVRQPGEITLPLNQKLLSGILTANDDEAKQAVRFAAQELKLVLEPAGALALASLLSKKIDVKGKTVVLILSGGNINDALLSEILASA